MSKTYGAIVLFFLLLAYYMFVPERICTVEWVNIDLNRIDGPFYTCPARIDKRRIGILEFTRIGNDVYRVTKIHGGSGRPPIGLRRQVSDNILFIKLDGPIDWDKLQDYYGSRYLSDGKVVFEMDGRKMQSLRPPLKVANLRSVPGMPGLESSYATDGHWVIRHGKVVEGADAATFRQLAARELDGTAVSYDPEMQFGRDQNAVFHGNQRFDDADRESFGLISYNRRRDPPPGINFPTDSVSRGSGWVAVDRKQAWEVTYLGVRPLAVTNAQLKALQEDLRKATAAAGEVPRRGPNGS